MWCDAQMGTEVATQDADLFVVDHLLAGVMGAVLGRGARYFVLETTLDAVVRSWRERKPVADALLANGLDRDVLLDRADRCIVITAPELDPVTAINAVQTGPFVTGSPSTPIEPTILVSLSTYNYPGLTAMLQRALDAVADLPVRVIASTAGIVRAEDLAVPANVELHEWLRYPETMPTVSALLGHGGHSTAMLALAHDLPVVVMPASAMTDQPEVGRRIQAVGAGRLVDSSDDPDTIGAAVGDVVNNLSYRSVAARIGAQIRGLNGLQTAADLVESRL
jgi:hypothetical protein